MNAPRCRPVQRFAARLRLVFVGSANRVGLDSNAVAHDVQRAALDLVVDAPHVLADHADRHELNAAQQQHRDDRRGDAGHELPRDPEHDGAFNPNRLSEIEPGTAYPYTIEFWRATGNVFAKGHRIRLDVSSSNFPRFDVNPNTGEPLQQHRRMVAADNTVYHNASQASFVELPIVPAGRK